MNLEKIREAADKLIGTHDFRNFCKKDKALIFDDSGEQNFFRCLYSIKFDPIFGESQTSTHPLLNMYVCTIRGSAFLWHQIRNTMAVFFIIGEGKEEPTIMDALLDIENVKEKPNYNMASDRPLILNDCQFEGIEFKDNLKGYVENHMACQEMLEQASIELCVQNTVMEHFNKIMIPSALLEVPESQGVLKGLDVKHET